MRIWMLAVAFASVSCSTETFSNALPFDASSEAIDDATVSDTASGDGGLADAGACRPVVCGYDGGDGGPQCGEGYNACGAYFNCGTCTSGSRATCDFHECACQPFTCAERQAGCGNFSNGCGGDLDCGVCSDASCQVRDAGPLAFACVAGPCFPTATACNGKCGDVTNNCGAIQHCGGCTDNSFCGLASATSCTCPARDKPLEEAFFASYGTHCWGNCPGYPTGTVVASLYATPNSGLVPLFRCDYTNSVLNPAHFLTLSPNCEALNKPPAETVGYCAPHDPIARCGAVSLYRYKNASGDDHVVVLEGKTPPVGYTANEGVLCDAWLD